MIVRAGVAALAALWLLVPRAEPSRITAGPKAPKEIRVLLHVARGDISTDERGAWRVVDAWGKERLRGARGSRLRWERDGRRLRAVDLDRGSATPWSDQPFALVPAEDSTVSWADRSYRGELRMVPHDTALLVLNILPLEQYLRSVVPLELGARPAEEHSALEAQAIAARSYAVVRSLEGVLRDYDIVAGPTDQVYGGVVAEHEVSSAAVERTAGIVLTYGGVVVRAPFHSTCGGETAAPNEVWSGGVESYLRRVSDRDGNGRAWCERSPRFAWERSVSVQELGEAIAKHRGLSATPSVRALRVMGLTTSGRVRELEVSVGAGAPIILRGNDIRFAIRDRAGALLPSTLFEIRMAEDGQRVVFRGRGNGHGVGLCQWGAIGRARAGHDAEDILAAYFPGTTLTRLQ